jgi:isopenicillin N synthase-like dioxygenase
MAEIPLVDFGAFLTGSQAQKERVAKQMDNAFRNVGFVYLRNAGVSKEMVEECFAWVRRLIPYPSVLV